MVMAKKSYAHAQLEAVAQEMRKTPDMAYYYEYQAPVSTLPTGEVLDLVKEFGTVRTSGRGWAIDEAWIAGAAIGYAAAGSPAIARLPAMASIFAIEYVYNQAGKLRSMTGGQASMPFVLWVDGGGRTRGSAGQHTEVGQEALYANLPGVKVVVPSNAYDAKGLLVAAIRDPDPVVYYDYGEVKSGDQPDVPDDAYEVPIGEAVVRQPGRDLTLVAWAPATVDVKQALPEMAKAGISVEYIDPRTLKPLDVETLAASVRKTRRLLVVEHGHYTNSFGSHVIAEMVQAVPGIRARKIAFPDVPGPGARGMMSYLRPDAPKIVDAAVQMMKA
jgi:pyruvate dehydrogenase E1 component beta subunit